MLLLTIDIITEDCGGTWEIQHYYHIYEWVEEHGNGQHIISSTKKLKLVEDK